MRFHHYTNISRRRDSALWKQGQTQAEISIERYHTICAALQKRYNIIQVPADPKAGRPWDRQGLTFSAYTAYQIEPVLGVKLHPLPDGTIHPGDIAAYCDVLQSNWKCREGGVMYCVAEYREWWNMLLNYHSPAGTTGRPDWDHLYMRLTENGYDKGTVPCMFFARASGCLDAKCPFLHDEEACRKEREQLLKERREDINRRHMRREISMREVEKMTAYRAQYPRFDDNGDHPEFERIMKESESITDICCSPACFKVNLKDQKTPPVKMFISTPANLLTHAWK
ncbi:hypothetical protein BV25DRAFT_1920846 [Artomyces pyxidatus]|uniref:Uncharacterized protein n=1 Tax=Artomyces pyxidatus TaxID=48021 RepID=A0ACB8SJI1_9AGAM|nr:hypothetical protein BV25DRAFT_1920846 [Artomyces pyxidatus]